MSDYAPSSGAGAGLCGVATHLDVDAAGIDHCLAAAADFFNKS